MPFWYFVKIPQLPREVAHQSNQVELKRYLLQEGDSVKAGTPVAILENYWSVIRLSADGIGLVSKLFFPSGTSVSIGDPIAIISADGEDLPYGKESCCLEIIDNKRQKS